MVRKQYQDYSYIDPEQIYTYPNSCVLINKFDERDGDKQRELEYQLVARQSLKLYLNPIGVYSVTDIQMIHHFLFQDMYDWAGQYRKVNISKNGDAFLPIQSFGQAESYLNQLIASYHKQSSSRAEMITSLVDILDNLNYFHPFREGNGRTQREVIRSLAFMKGYECEIALGTDDRIYHLYMDGTVYGDKNKLKELFESILRKIYL